jgi:hypothetical protein
VSAGVKYAWPGWLMSAMPWIALGVIVAGALHVRIALGHWPEMNQDHYRSNAWSAHQFVIAWTTVASAVVVPPVWLILLLFRPMRFSGEIHAVQVTLFFIGWAFIILFGVTDPMGFVGWWLD